jgi:uncharacterized membrane protein YbhN (UPF0104 family)
VRAAARVVTTVVLIGLLLAVVWDRRGELVDLVEDPSWDLAVIGVLVVVGHFLNSAEFWVLYRAQGLTRFGLLENWMVFTAGQLGNLLPGQMGSIYKFRYMKVVHGFDYARSGSNYGANLVVTLVSSAVAGLLGLGLSTGRGVAPSPLLFVAFGGVGVASALMLAFPLPHLGWLPGRARRVWVGFREGWEELRRQPNVAAVAVVLDLAKYVLVAIRFQVAFSLIGIDEPFTYFLVIAPAAGVAGMLAFTPGGIGFREAFIAAAAVGMGSELDAGLLAATVDRGVMLAASLVLGSVGWVYTSRRMRHAAASVVREEPGSLTARH